MTEQPRKIVVNGETVEYFNIQHKLDGTMEITFSKEFNIVDAHHSEIMKRLRENNVDCQVFKRFKQNIIILWLYNIEDLHMILHTLKIPAGTYEVNNTDCIVTIDIQKLQNNTLTTQSTIEKGVGTI